jgi:four helix bundle protein
MAQATTPRTGADSGDRPPAQEPLLDAEKLEVYRVAMQASVEAESLISPPEKTLRGQLERASTSVILTIAEGAGRRSRRDKGHYYTMARGSAAECAAIIDLAQRRGLAPAADCRHVRALYVRAVQMTTKLVLAFG